MIHTKHNIHLLSLAQQQEGACLVASALIECNARFKVRKPLIEDVYCAFLKCDTDNAYYIHQQTNRTKSIKDNKFCLKYHGNELRGGLGEYGALADDLILLGIIGASLV